MRERSREQESKRKRERELRGRCRTYAFAKKRRAPRGSLSGSLALFLYLSLGLSLPPAPGALEIILYFAHVSSQPASRSTRYILPRELQTSKLTACRDVSLSRKRLVACTEKLFPSLLVAPGRSERCNADDVTAIFALLNAGHCLRPECGDRSALPEYPKRRARG